MHDLAYAALDNLQAALQTTGNPQVMGDDDQGDALLTVESQQQFDDVLCSLAIEVAGGLVGEQQLWLTDEGAGNGHSLALAPGELCRAVVQPFAEAYPQLRASEAFTRLQDELSGIESGIAYARQYYNDSVLSYENARTTLPTMPIASLFGFHRRDYFKAAAGAETPVAVSFQ